MSDAVVIAGPVGAARSDRRRPLRTLAGRPAAVVGLAGVTLIVGMTVLAPLVAPHDPAAQDLSNILAPPVWAGGDAEHLLGTDALGRDVTSRLIYGGRNSLLISSAAMLIGSCLGLATGLIAGFVGGRVDTLTMRLGDVQLAFPFILFAIAYLGVVPERTPLHLIVVLGIPGLDRLRQGDSQPCVGRAREGLRTGGQGGRSKRTADGCSATYSRPFGRSFP